MINALPSADADADQACGAELAGASPVDSDAVGQFRGSGALFVKPKASR
ncbi:hypothetical protein [Rhodococcus zopfii]|nr:hypothetical protein [Rhodococcus zopfii]